MSQVRADATVTRLFGSWLKPLDGPERPMWEVEVTGLPPHAKRRLYTLPADNEDQAAMNGLQRFVAEMERAQALS